MTIPDDEDLEDLKRAAGDDPDKRAAFEVYVSALANLEEAHDERSPDAVIDAYEKQVSEARFTLDQWLDN